MKKIYINLFLLSIVILQNNIFSMEKSNTSNAETEKKETNLFNIMHELLEKIIHDVVESHIINWDGTQDFNMIKKEIAKDLTSIQLTSKYFSGIIEYNYLKNNKGFNELVINSIIKTIDKQLQNKILNYEQNRREKTDELIKLLNQNSFSRLTRERDYLQKIMQLIYDGADINVQDNHGRTALMHIVIEINGRAVGLPLTNTNRQYEAAKNAVELLIAAGANINLKNKCNRTALMYAAMDKRGIDIVKLLIASGANIDIKDDSGKTALIYAAMEKRGADIVKLLIDSVVDINATDNSGKTALIYAAMNKRGVDIVKLLIASGANINATDNSGKTALKYAVKKDREDIVELLNASSIDN